MSEIVNLRRVKKARAQAEADAQAAANRARYGQTPAERQAVSRELARRDTGLDGARIIRDGEPRE